MDLFSESLIMPSNLRFFLHRLAEDAQPSTNILKINAMNSTSASSGGLVTVRLPMSLVDLNSFAMFFSTSTTNGTSYSGIAQTILPRGVESILSRMEVSVNGLGLLNLQQYNVIYNALKDSHMDMDKSMMRRVLQNECDTTPIFVPATPATGCTVGSGQAVFVSGITAASSSGATNAVVSGVCGALYNGLGVGAAGEDCSNLPWAQLGFTFATMTSVSLTAVSSVPAYVQTVGGQLIYGPLVSKLTFTGIGTGISYSAPSGGFPSSDPQYSFSAYVQNSTMVGITPTAVLVPTTASSVNSAFSTSTPYVGTPPYYLPNQNNFHCISDWLSFFKAQPQWLQTQMLGEIEVRLTLADNSILCYPPDASMLTRGDYQLNNIYFTIRTCSFDNNLLDDILSEKLASGGELEIPYPNIYNVNQVQSAGSSSTRFSVNTQCLNKVIGINRPSYYNTLLGSMKHIPTGYGVRSDNNVGLVHKGAYFQTYSSTAPFNATAITAPNYWQYQINNSFIPNIKIDPSFDYFNYLESWSLHNDWLSSTIAGNPALFLNANYQATIALDFMDASIPRLVSGIDTRGAVSVAYFLQDNNNNGDRTDIFTLFTSILKVSSNQQIQVVF